MYSVVAFGTFTMLCNHHLCLVPNISSSQKELLACFHLHEGSKAVNPIEPESRSVVDSGEGNRQLLFSWQKVSVLGLPWWSSG